MFAAYERTVAPLLVRSADRVCVLSADHADSVPYLRRHRRAGAGEARGDAERRRRRRVLPGRRRAGPARAARDPGGRAGLAAFAATLDRAHHFKRLDVAIDALARACGDPQPHLLVAGGGELLDGFRDRALQPGVADRVHFLGAVPHAELPSVLRAADAFVLTTEPPESFGIVLIEAMACGLPVIATDYPGVRAVVDDGETGIVVPPGDAGACRRRDRPARRPTPRRGRGWERPDGRRRSASGPGPRSSTAWTPPTPRRSPSVAGRMP